MAWTWQIKGSLHRSSLAYLRQLRNCSSRRGQRHLMSDKGPHLTSLPLSKNWMCNILQMVSSRRSGGFGTPSAIALAPTAAMSSPCCFFRVYSLAFVPRLIAPFQRLLYSSSLAVFSPSLLNILLFLPLFFRYRLDVLSLFEPFPFGRIDLSRFSVVSCCPVHNLR